MSLPLAITALIPHRRPMLLLDELVSHGERSIVCAATIRDDTPFVTDGAAPALLALELFAQTAAVLVAHALVKNKGAAASVTGTSLGRGALLGTEEITLHHDTIAVGDRLEVRCELREMQGTAAEIDCTLARGEEVIAEGAILVMAG